MQTYTNENVPYDTQSREYYPVPQSIIDIESDYIDIILDNPDVGLEYLATQFTSIKQALESAAGF
jgi:hypothetical protein